MKKLHLLLFLFLIYSARDVLSQTPILVEEGNSFGTYTDIDRIIKINSSGSDVILFPSRDATYGRELWKYEESTGNSTIVKDMENGSNSSRITELTQFNNKGFFVDVDFSNGFELWCSDGTAAGTQLYFDVSPGSGGSFPEKLTVVNSSMYFAAFSNTQLWKTNGTSAPNSTVLVKSIFNYSSEGHISKLFPFGNKLIFSTYNKVTTLYTLWVTDGTLAGTIELASLNNSLFNMIEYNGLLLFSNSNASTGNELWKTDGTVAGTQMVKDIIPGGNSSNPSSFTIVGSFMYFSANNAIYKTDGTISGTELTINHNGYFLKGINGALYFAKSTSYPFGIEIYKSDGTNAGTFLLKSIESYENQSNQITFFENGTTDVFFKVKTREFGSEIWKTDGTMAGTTLLKDIRVGLNGSDASNFLKSGNNVYFTAKNSSNGFGLYKTNGTTAGTIRLSSFVGINRGTSPDEVFTFGNSILYNGYYGFERRFFQVNSAFNSGIPYNTYYYRNIENYFEFNNNLYFSAESILGNELHSYSSSFSLNIVKDIFTGTTASVQNSSNPSSLTALNNSTFMFSAEDADGAELWKSDGTNAGTVKVKNINTSGSSFPNSLVKFNNKINFWAYTPAEGVELWESDGTEANTHIVQNFNGSSNSANIQSQIIGNNTKLVFPLFTNFLSGQELYGYDGTSISLIKDIYSGVTSSFPENFIKGQGENIYFTAVNRTTGRELWITDGTNANTQIVKDINPNGSSNPVGMIMFNNELYFSADDGTHGFELWKTDGTAAGTVLVKDIFSGATPSSPGSFCIVNNALYFSAESQNFGRELWKTDGTSSGTVLAYNIADDYNNEINSSDPFDLKFVNNYLYFSADNKINGRELYYYKPCNLTSGYVNNYQSSSTQTSQSTLFANQKIGFGRTFNLQAPQSINLNPGFSVKALDDYSSVNNIFTAEIKACY